jgi:hypothetical protein
MLAGGLADCPPGVSPFTVDLPIKDGDFPWLFVCLPEGSHNERKLVNE